MDQGPPNASELVLRRRRRADRVSEVLDDRVLRPAADGQRLADVALFVDQHKARLLALAVDDLELVVGARLVFHEARDDGVVLELSLADLEPRLDVRDFVVVGAAGPAVFHNVLVGHERFQRRAGAAAQRRREARGDAVDGFRVAQAERQRGRAGVMAAHRSMRSALLPTQRFSSARAGSPQGWQARRREAAGKHHQGEAKRVPYAAVDAARQRSGPGRNLNEPGRALDA